MSKLLVPFRGVIEIVAGHDVGKTLAGLQTVYPYDNTVFVDDDEKGSGIVEQIQSAGGKFGEYIDLGKLRAKIGETPTADQLLDEIVRPTIAKITEKKRDVIIWDTWRIVYQAARAHVAANQQKYKDVVTFRGTSSIIQGLISKVARMIENKQLNELRAKCDLLVITHHLKDRYENNVVVGKIPESSRTFSEICNMRLWLRRNPNSKVPIILFLKRPVLPKMVDGQIKFINIVPMKITPTDKDESIWSAIARYGEDPIESRRPRIDETPTAEEFAMLSGVLTADQKSYVLEILKHQKEEAEEATTVANSMLPTENLTKSFEDEYEPPKNSGAFLARCMKDYGMNGEAINKTLGVGIDKIMEMNKNEIAKLWEKVIKAGEKK